MAPFQMWLVQTLAAAGAPFVRPLLYTRWGWPACESLHFIGLSLLIGAVGAFDLRLLGVARRIPIGALHRLIPWGVAGYGLNVVTGSMFLMTEPDQYVYNPSFHLKLVFMAIAGLNILFFYTRVYRTVSAAGAEATRAARLVAAISLGCWLGVIVCGRLLTFYRPGPCGTAGPGVVARCIPAWR